MPLRGINLTMLPRNGVVEAQSVDLNVQTDEKERFHYGLKGCCYPSRVIYTGMLLLCGGYTKIRRRVHIPMTGKLYKVTKLGI